MCKTPHTWIVDIVQVCVIGHGNKQRMEHKQMCQCHKYNGQRNFSDFLLRVKGCYGWSFFIQMLTCDVKYTPNLWIKIEELIFVSIKILDVTFHVA